MAGENRPPSGTPSLRAWLRLALALSLLLVGPTASAELVGDRFYSKVWRVRLTTPRNWNASEQSSYPNVLLWMVRRDPAGKILLSAEHVTKTMTALEYANRTQKLLAKLGFRVRTPQPHPSGAYYLDFDNKKSFLRQALLVIDGIGYALTLSAPSVSARAKHLRAFEITLQSISIDRRRSGESGDSEEGKDSGSKTPKDGASNDTASKNRDGTPR